MKVFVLGLDGATFNCLLPLMEEGIIPNIRELYAHGASAPLRTIFPPVTAPAWLALATGLNPGKTGAFDYINRSESGSDRMIPISSAYYEGRSVWNYLNSVGIRTGIFNYPTLSPPPKVYGFAVTGIGSYEKEDLCYPAGLKDELDKITGGYETRLNLRNPHYKRDIALFFKDLTRIIQKQAAALKYLVQHKEWDLLFGVYSFTDWMQHVIWKYIDASHPQHDPASSPSVQRMYQDTWKLIDASIGELRAALPKEAVVMIVSDHGAGPLHSVFYANTWLEQKGWLRRRNLGWKSLVANNVRLFSSGSDNKYAHAFTHLLRKRVLGLNSSLDLVDREGSLAYSPEHNTMFGCINLTDRGKRMNGLREELIVGLRNLPKEIDGIETVEIILPENVYTGPYTDLSPDIFFIINNYRTTIEVDLTKKPFVASPSIEMRTGGHLPDGVFIAHGDQFDHKSLENVSVLDIMPTILALFNIEIPAQLDGQVIVEALRPDVRQKLMIRTGNDAAVQQTAVQEKGDLDEMKKMLQSLGYM